MSNNLRKTVTKPPARCDTENVFTVSDIRKMSQEELRKEPRTDFETIIRRQNYVIYINNILAELIKKSENELAKIRDQFTTYQPDSPGRDEAMERIAGLEARLARLHEGAEQISKILKCHDVATFRELDELRRKHENAIAATGNRVWQELLFVRGQGKYGVGDRTRWLPSDLIKVEGFPELEAQARKDIDEANDALPKVIHDLKTITSLVDGF